MALLESTFIVIASGAWQSILESTFAKVDSTLCAFFLLGILRLCYGSPRRFARLAMMGKVAYFVIASRCGSSGVAIHWHSPRIHFELEPHLAQI
ncbi:hypothetical protein [Helicobacter canis]|uniref:hypothetical protein n=1 Tax=Helicobacter canis TaxID=29419 RepID=UPI000E0FAE32|nr:hypothetical protein [Helicobacter canis]